MRSKRLRYRFANRHYAYGRWPTGLPLMPSQLSPQISQINLYDCCLYAGLSRPSKTRRTNGISHAAYRKLAKEQSEQIARNSYHNQAHIAQVIIAAGLLADHAKITQTERDLLLFAALIHDYGHRGRWRNKSAYWQELQSFASAMRKSVRLGVDVRLLLPLHQMIMATSPIAPDDRADIKGNDIVSLLLDADLFASLFLPKKQVDQLTAKLKFEDRLAAPCQEMRAHFISVCEARGLASLAGQMLHERLSPSQTYFRS